MKKQAKMTKILKDHKLVNKKLQPPFFNSFKDWKTQFIEVSYIEKIFPEIIWLGLLNKNMGVQKSAQAILDLSKLINSIQKNKNAKCFSFISNYKNLNLNEITELLNLKHPSVELIKINIQSFIKVFPNSPLSFLKDNTIDYSKEDLYIIKETMKDLSYKNNSECVFALSNVIYHLLELGILKVPKDSCFMNLNEISNYPNSYESKKIAGAVRASLNSLIRSDLIDVKYSDWVKYFWNRAFEIEPYQIENLYFE